jgi:hypothetical protein
MLLNAQSVDTTINHFILPMDKNVNYCLNTNIYSYLQIAGGQISNLYLNSVHFLIAGVN